MIIARAFAGKHYAVYGLARSGLATAEALLASGAKVTAWDAKEEARARAPAGTEIANLDEVDLGQFDSLVVTPGLPLNRHPIAKRARDAGVEIIGDIELFARARWAIGWRLSGRPGVTTRLSNCPRSTSSKFAISVPAGALALASSLASHAVTFAPLASNASTVANPDRARP